MEGTAISTLRSDVFVGGTSRIWRTRPSGGRAYLSKYRRDSVHWWVIISLAVTDAQYVWVPTPHIPVEGTQLCPVASWLASAGGTVDEWGWAGRRSRLWPIHALATNWRQKDNGRTCKYWTNRQPPLPVLRAEVSGGCTQTVAEPHFRWESHIKPNGEENDKLNMPLRIQIHAKMQSLRR